MKQKSSQGSGFLGRKGKREYRWATSVQNFHRGPRTIEIREQLPRSKQKDIVVTSMEFDPKPLAEDPNQPKLVRWRLRLPSKEKARILFSYRVKYPDDVRVSGLE